VPTISCKNILAFCLVHSNSGSINKFKKNGSAAVRCSQEQSGYQTGNILEEIPTVETQPNKQFLVDGGVDVIDFDVKDNDDDSIKDSCTFFNFQGITLKK
jgi:hypothetical protein